MWTAENACRSGSQWCLGLTRSGSKIPFPKHQQPLKTKTSNGEGLPPTLAPVGPWQARPDSGSGRGIALPGLSCTDKRTRHWQRRAPGQQGPGRQKPGRERLFLSAQPAAPPHPSHGNYRTQTHKLQNATQAGNPAASSGNFKKS